MGQLLILHISLDNYDRCIAKSRLMYSAMCQYKIIPICCDSLNLSLGTNNLLHQHSCRKAEKRQTTLRYNHSGTGADPL